MSDFTPELLGHFRPNEEISFNEWSSSLQQKTFGYVLFNSLLLWLVQVIVLRKQAKRKNSNSLKERKNKAGLQSLVSEGKLRQWSTREEFLLFHAVKYLTALKPQGRTHCAGQTSQEMPQIPKDPLEDINIKDIGATPSLS